MLVIPIHRSYTNIAGRVVGDVVSSQLTIYILLETRANVFALGVIDLPSQASSSQPRRLENR